MIWIYRFVPTITICSRKSGWERGDGGEMIVFWTKWMAEATSVERCEMTCVRRPMDIGWVGRRGWYELCWSGGGSRRVVSGEVRNRHFHLEHNWPTKDFLRGDGYGKEAAGASATRRPSHGLAQSRETSPPESKYHPLMYSYYNFC